MKSSEGDRPGLWLFGERGLFVAERPPAVGCQLGAPQARGTECQSSVQPELWLASFTDEARPPRQIGGLGPESWWSRPGAGAWPRGCWESQKQTPSLLPPVLACRANYFYEPDRVNKSDDIPALGAYIPGVEEAVRYRVGSRE